MENKIPTTEEMMKRGTGNFLHCTDYEDAIEAMKKFAKLHVEAALKEAAEKAKIKYEYSGNTGSEYCDEYVDQNSILNAYPLTNIK